MNFFCHELNLSQLSFNEYICWCQKQKEFTNQAFDRLQAGSHSHLHLGASGDVLSSPAEVHRYAFACFPHSALFIPICNTWLPGAQVRPLQYLIFLLSMELKYVGVFLVLVSLLKGVRFRQYHWYWTSQCYGRNWDVYLPRSLTMDTCISLQCCRSGCSLNHLWVCPLFWQSIKFKVQHRRKIFAQFCLRQWICGQVSL